MMVRTELTEAKIDDWGATKLQLARYYRTKYYDVSTQEFCKATTDFGPAKSIKLPNLFYPLGFRGHTMIMVGKKIPRAIVMTP